MSASRDNDSIPLVTNVPALYLLVCEFPDDLNIGAGMQRWFPGNKTAAPSDSHGDQQLLRQVFIHHQVLFQVMHDLFHRVLRKPNMMGWLP